MLCPVCKVNLTMTDRQGIEIDYCPQCRGVWLDRGELDKIIERSASMAPPPDAGMRRPEYRERHQDRDEDYHPHRRRKSWLEELFD